VKGSSLASSSIGIKKKIRNLKLGDALSPRGPHRRSAASRTSTPRSTNAQGPAADATPTGSWRSKGTSTPRTSSPRHNRFGPGGIYRKAYTDNIGIGHGTLDKNSLRWREPHLTPRSSDSARAKSIKTQLNFEAKSKRRISAPDVLYPRVRQKVRIKTMFGVRRLSSPVAAPNPLAMSFLLGQSRVVAPSCTESDTNSDKSRSRASIVVSPEGDRVTGDQVSRDVGKSTKGNDNSATSTAKRVLGEVILKSDRIHDREESRDPCTSQVIPTNEPATPRPGENGSSRGMTPGAGLSVANRTSSELLKLSSEEKKVPTPPSALPVVHLRDQTQEKRNPKSNQKSNQKSDQNSTQKSDQKSDQKSGQKNELKGKGMSGHKSENKREESERNGVERLKSEMSTGLRMTRGQGRILHKFSKARQNQNDLVLQTLNMLSLSTQPQPPVPNEPKVPAFSCSGMPVGSRPSFLYEVNLDAKKAIRFDDLEHGPSKKSRETPTISNYLCGGLCCALSIPTQTPSRPSSKTTRDHQAKKPKGGIRKSRNSKKIPKSVNRRQRRPYLPSFSEPGVPAPMGMSMV